MTDLIQDWLLDPTALLFMTSALTILLLWRRSDPGSRSKPKWRVMLFVGWIAVILVCSAPAVVNPLLATLEDQYPDTLVCESGSHLIMLGGGVDSRAGSDTEFERMSHSTMSRATSALRIANDEPQLRLIAAGGALERITEADVIANYWNAMGIDDQRIVRESSSSNTHENAINVARLLGKESVQGPVRLLTSAMHMPRALLSFRSMMSAQGLDVCPVSVDQQVIPDVPFWALMPQTTALVKFDKWLHEIIALAVYRLRGWI
ncbi:YdcF family protein [Granulosicoccus sp.]|nr:YdcF family protein [Granulosicoccus sp.]